MVVRKRGEALLLQTKTVTYENSYPQLLTLVFTTKITKEMKTSEDPILKGRWSFMAKMLAAIFFVQYAWEIMLDSEAFLQRWHLSQQKIPCLIIVRHTSTVLLDNHCNCAQLYVAFLRRNACIVERIHKVPPECQCLGVLPDSSPGRGGLKQTVQSCWQVRSI